MAAIKYGQTWWGQQWLQALNNIDWSNRLPRGRSYANNGSVREVSIEGNTITARVKGSRPQPYKIAIKVPSFSAGEKEKLVIDISQNPVLISRLLNRELDPAILTTAENLGIRVFPKSWSDIDMECSCPDWAVPCKHIAAVIYKVCAEIDNNPFLIFHLHKLDLVEALKEKKIVIAGQAETRFLTVQEVLGVQQGKKGKEKKQERREREDAETGVDTTLPQLNYAAINNILEPLVRILPDAPPFYSLGNFRTVYETALKKVAKTVQGLFSGKKELSYEVDYYFARKTNLIKELQLRFDDELTVLYNSEFVASVLCGGKEVTAYSLTKALHALPPSLLPDYHRSINVFYHLQLLALNLLQNGAVVPQLFTTGEGVFRIRWLPATIDENVKRLLQQVEDAIPTDLTFLKEGKEALPCTGTAVPLCSFFLTHFISAWSSTEKSDNLSSLFFNAVPHPFTRFGEQAVPSGIAAWLHRFSITQQQYVPVVKIEEWKDEKFAIALEVENRKEPDSLPVPLQVVLTLKRFEKERYAILQSITLLSNFITGLDAYLQQGAMVPVVMDAKAFAHFLFEMLPAIRLLAIRTVLPRSLQHILKPKPTVKLQKKPADSATFLRLDDLLDFQWQVAVGDTVLTDEEFRQLLRRSQGIIKFRNQFIYLDPAEVERLQKALEKPPALSGIELLRSALSEEWSGNPVLMTGEVRALIKELTEQKEIPLPKGLQATLRPYQCNGYWWLYRNTKIGFGSLLADDMGLGKTLQVITTLLKFKEEGWLQQTPALVVAPTSLLTNWSRELDKFAPSLRYQVYHGGARKLKEGEFDVLLTSYGLARSDNAVLKKKKWLAVITDEAQNIKNPGAEQTKAVKSLPAKTYIAMSGTPVENRLSEYWSIMDFANRGLLGNLNFFQSNFARPIQNQHDAGSLDRFKKIVSPFLLRRLKSDKRIIADLPDKLEVDQFCTLTKEQAALYETVLEKSLKAINEVGDENEDLFHRQGLVLQMIMALKQICNHPAQFLKNKKKEAGLSGKVQLLLQLLEPIYGNHEKTLIFTQFTEMASMLQEFIKEKFGYEPLYLHGGQSRKQREEMVQRFQTVPHERFFILSLKAGGTGLNLTAAQNVIHFDLWWNPAVEAQATDRAYRIGQKKNVMVHRFITKGTFEEKINEMIQSKKELAEMSVGTGEKWIGNLSNKELKELFELG